MSASPPERTTAVQSALRAAAWVLMILVGWATLSPLDLRPHPFASADLERFVAFAGVTFVFVLAYHPRVLSVVFAIAATACALEAAQHLVPDRHGHLHDLAFKLAGTMSGAGAAVLVLAIVHQMSAARRPAVRGPTGGDGMSS